ncbi:MAG TPA: VCBS repeat-containing protein, partial [Bacteroidales bacterium]|nr:VCBS repeat-containing protein [Bacteroidales bacterium]
MGKLQISALIFILPAFIGLQAQIFSPAQKISNADNPQVVRSADFNSDGYADVVYSSIADHKIAVAFYDAVSGSFGAEQVLSTAFTYAVSLFAADLNGDSFVDVLTVSQISNTVAWFKNDGSGGFILQPLISSNAGGAIGVIAEDIDGDDDNDVIVAAKDDNTIGWYENTDGNGSFSPAHIITDEGEFPVVILSADPDNDGDQDIVAGMLAGNSIVWYPNDGNGNFGVESPITTEVNFISAIYAADLNGDGNIDIVSASRSDNKIAWYENLGGNGVFSSQHIVSEYVTMAYDVVAADFDLDNDQDLVCSAMGSNQILVFNNQDGAGNFLPAQMISEV